MTRCRVVNSVLVVPDTPTWGAQLLGDNISVVSPNAALMKSLSGGSTSLVVKPAAGSRRQRSSSPRRARSSTHS